jgi:hypothetical protein
MQGELLLPAAVLQCTSCISNALHTHLADSAWHKAEDICCALEQFWVLVALLLLLCCLLLLLSWICLSAPAVLLLPAPAGAAQRPGAHDGRCQHRAW